MEWYAPSKAANIVRDWDKAQALTHPTDQHVQILRDIGIRYVSIENSGLRPIGIAITTFYEGVLPKLQFVLQPGDVKPLGINSHGSSLQFVHILDPITQKPVGSPFPIRSNAQQLVLRDGLNMWFVQAFQTPGFAVR